MMLYASSNTLAWCSSMYSCGQTREGAAPRNTLPRPCRGVPVPREPACLHVQMYTLKSASIAVDELVFDPVRQALHSATHPSTPLPQPIV